MTINDKASPTTTQAAGARHDDAAAHALSAAVAREAKDLSHEVQHMAREVAGETQKTVESTLSDGKSRAAEGLRSVAKAIRTTGEQMKAEDQGALTPYLDGAARQVDVASRYLQTRTLTQVVGDVESFARREPALFIGGAFVAGLLGGRFLKSARSTSPPSGYGGAPGGGWTERSTRMNQAPSFAAPAGVPRPQARTGAIAEGAPKAHGTP